MNQRTTIYLGFLGAAVLFVHYRTFEWLLQVWLNHSRWSHGFLIPLIASYLVWIKRDQLAQIHPRPNLAVGGPLLLLGAILHVTGRASGSVLAEAFSLLALLPGIVLSVWGPGHLRAIILPLGYLQFMIPWTEEFFAQATPSFQLLSARLAALFLQAMGFSVFRDATHLQLPHVALEVTPDCSGLGFLYSMIALSIPLVYLTQRTWWRAAGVLMYGAAIPVLANAARVAFAGAIGYYNGGSTLRGPLHIFEGWFVSQVGMLVLFLTNWAVAKLPCDSTLRLHERWKGAPAGNAGPANTLSRAAGSSALLMLPVLGFAYTYGWFAAQVGILLVFLVYWAVKKLPRKSHVKLHERWKGLTTDVVPTNTLSRTAGSSTLLILSLLGFGFYLHFVASPLFASPHPVPPKQSLRELPYVIDRWKAQDSTWFDGGRFFPGTTAGTIRTYHNDAGEQILLYIGYFASQRQGESLTSRLSNPIRRDARELTLPKAIAGLQRVNHSVPTIDGKRYEAISWYHLPSGKTTGRYETKLRQFLDPVIRGHNSGAVVLLATAASENQGGAAAVNDLMEFTKVLAPVLEEFLP